MHGNVGCGWYLNESRIHDDNDLPHSRSCGICTLFPLVHFVSPDGDLVPVQIEGTRQMKMLGVRATAHQTRCSNCFLSWCTNILGHTW